MKTMPLSGQTGGLCPAEQWCMVILVYVGFLGLRDV